MRERHFPRLCQTCQAPMARQEDRCWSCGAAWAAGGAAMADSSHTMSRVVRPTRITVDVSDDHDRWSTDGGPDEPQPAEPVTAGATRS